MSSLVESPKRPVLDGMSITSDTLYVLSHRLPVVFDDRSGWRRSPGGLVSALAPSLEHRRAIWFGHCTPGAPAPPQQSGTLSVVPIRVPAIEAALAIDGYCNATLWPALHGIVERIEQRPEWWSAYAARGASTAALLAERAERGATVWIHDYHHLAVARPLRMKRRDLRIGLFFHTPFDDRAMRMLERSGELADHIGAVDFVGTQTARDAAGVRCFLRSGGVVPAPAIGAVPVGFDVAAWDRFRSNPGVAAIAADHLAPEGVLAIGVDRIDYTKGLVPKLSAIELLLDTGVITPDEFRLVQVAVPSRQGVPAYAALEAEVRQIAARANAAHSRRDRRPVVDLRLGQLPPCEVAGLMRAADMALVTPVRDGMNLVAFEFSVVNADRQTDLVLGVGAGAADHLGRWCQTVDGADAVSIAATILHLLRTLDTGRGAQSRRRAEIAASFTGRRWTDAFLDRLKQARGAALSR